MRHTSLPSAFDIEVNYNADAWVGHSFSGGGFFSGDLESLTSKFGGYCVAQGIPELTTNRRKYLVLFNLAYFHSIIDTLTLVFKVESVSPGMLFVIYVDSTQVGNSEVFPYMLKVLKANGIDFVVVETPYNVSGTGLEHVEHPVISRVTNFSYIGSENERVTAGFDATLVDVKYALDRVREFAVGSVESIGSRKTYLSRKKVGYVSLPAELAAEYEGYASDLRLSGEEELEEYLRGEGFEIVCPEDFSNYEEQVRYLSDVRVLVSSTGSGMLNLGLMPDGGTVVELRCELLFSNDGREGEFLEPYQVLIGQYADISYIKGHTHILVSAKEKEASGVIDALKKLKLGWLN